MDKNIAAILNVHGALLFALIATHPQPQALLREFAARVELIGEQQQWTELFLSAIRQAASTQG